MVAVGKARFCCPSLSWVLERQDFAALFSISGVVPVLKPVILDSLLLYSLSGVPVTLPT